MKAMDIAKIAAVVAGAFVTYKFFQKVKDVGGNVAAAGKKFVAEDLNPASDKNLVYSGVNAVGAKVTGDDSFSLGGWLYEKFNDDPLASQPSNVTKQAEQIAIKKPYTPWELDDSSVKKPSFVDPFAIHSTDFGDDGMLIKNGIDFKLF